MATARYHKVKIGEHELNAETLMLGYGYDPSLSEGSVKPPVFLTSTFVFQTAEQGRDFFVGWLHRVVWDRGRDVVMVVYLHEALDRKLAAGSVLQRADIEQAAIEGAVQRACAPN
jgi:cystathionine beta-lyase/cystathionine gamma-synthase